MTILVYLFITSVIREGTMVTLNTIYTKYDFSVVIVTSEGGKFMKMILIFFTL